MPRLVPVEQSQRRLVPVQTQPSQDILEPQFDRFGMQIETAPVLDRRQTQNRLDEIAPDAADVGEFVGSVGGAVAGGVGGGAAGTAVGGPGVGTTVGMFTGGVTGAGAGAAAGREIGQKFSNFLRGQEDPRTPEQRSQEIKDTALTNAAFQAVPLGVVAKPFKALKNVVVKPGDELKTTIEAAERQGVKLPISAQVQSRLVRFLENRASQSGLSQGIYNKVTQELDESTINAYNKALDDISTVKLDATEAGEGIQDALKGAQEYVADVTRQRYNQVYNLVDGSSPAGATNTLSLIDDIEKRLVRSPVPSAQESEALAYVQRLKQGLQEGATIDQLLAQKVSANEAINFDIVGGSKSLLKQIPGAIKKDIEQFGNETGNKQFLDAFNAAEDYFQNTTTAKIRERFVQSLIKNERPDDLLYSANTPGKWRQLESAIATSPETKKALPALRRAKLEQMIGAKITREADGSESFNFGRYLTALDPKSKDFQVIKQLLRESPNAQKALADLREISSGVVGGSQFINRSQSGVVAADVAALAAGAAQIGAGSVVTGVLTASSPYLIAKMMTNPRIMRAITRAAKAQTPKARLSAENQLQDLLSKAGLAQALRITTEQNLATP